MSLFREPVDCYFLLRLALGLVFCVAFLSLAGGFLGVLGLPTPVAATVAVRVVVRNAVIVLFTATAFWLVGRRRRQTPRAS